MSGTFICYELLDISRRSRFVRDEFSNVIDHLAEDLMSLIYKARKENANKPLVDSMTLIRSILLRIKEVTSSYEKCLGIEVEVEGENK
jgi:hypothetical protein